MRTFSVNIKQVAKFVVPDTFLANLRRDCQEESATVFMKKAQEMHPTNDDALLTHVLRNGIKNNVRGQLLMLMQQSNIGGTVTPTVVEMVPMVPDFNTDVGIEVVHRRDAAEDERVA